MATPATWAVCVRAVLIWRDEVVLVRSARGEWELPGATLERGESPEECVERALDDELGLYATAERLLDTWVEDGATPDGGLVVTYGCSVNVPDPQALTDEQPEVRFFPIGALGSLGLAARHAESIKAWHRLLGR